MERTLQFISKFNITCSRTALLHFFQAYKLIVLFLEINIGSILLQALPACHQQSAIAASLFRVCIINGSFNEGAYQDVLVNSGCLPSYDTKFLTATGNPITIPGQTHSPPSLKSHYLSPVANCTRHTCKLSLITWVSELMGHLAQTLV